MVHLTDFPPHSAPETVPAWDAPELYIPPQADKYPSTSVHQYSGGDSPMSIRHQDSGLESARTPTTIVDTEKADSGRALAETKWWQRRVCGVPLLWVLAVFAMVAVGGTIGGVVASFSSGKESQATDHSTTNTTTSTPSNTTAAQDIDETPLQPTWQDKWYYIKNDLLIPENETVVKFDEASALMTAGYLTKTTGEPYEHWAFKTVPQNTSSFPPSAKPTTSPPPCASSITVFSNPNLSIFYRWRIGYGWRGIAMRATVMKTGYREGPEREEGVGLAFTKTDDEVMWDGQAWRLEVAASFGED